MQTLKHWVGIDVCKRWLDVHLRPQAVSFRVPNTAQGLALLSSRLPDASLVGRILLESTGGYERQAALFLGQLGYPVVVINARQARNECQSRQPTGENRYGRCGNLGVVRGSDPTGSAPTGERSS